jgi:hypothetical protein
VVDGSDEYLLYSHDTNNDIYEDKNDGTDTQKVTGTCYRLSCNTYDDGGQKIAYFWLDSTTEKYGTYDTAGGATRQVQGASSGYSVNTTTLNALKTVRGSSSGYSTSTAALSTLRAVAGTSVGVSSSTGNITAEAPAANVEGTVSGYSSGTAETQTLRAVAGASFAFSFSSGTTQFGPYVPPGGYIVRIVAGL